VPYTVVAWCGEEPPVAKRMCAGESGGTQGTIC
jgi:hypothetical protein